MSALEIQAVTLGVEVLMETGKRLSGDTSVIPIHIEEMKLYSDSMVSLQWINKHVNALEKNAKTFCVCKKSLGNNSTTVFHTEHHVTLFSSPVWRTRPTSSPEQLVINNY